MADGSERRRFTRDQRLLRPAEFRAVFADPCRVSSREVVLLSRANSLGYPRLGLAIAKKHVKRAVDRNRIKRQARESFRAAQADLPALDIVVLARSGIATVEPDRLWKTFDQLWLRLAEQCGS